MIPILFQQGGAVTQKCEKCSSGSEDDTKANNHSCRDYFKKLPRVLILYLPRTAWLEEMRDAQKNRVKIQVPNVLDLKNHCAKDCNHEEIEVPEAIRKRPYRKRKSSFSLLDDMNDDEDLFSISSSSSFPQKKMAKVVSHITFTKYHFFIHYDSFFSKKNLSTLKK